MERAGDPATRTRLQRAQPAAASVGNHARPWPTPRWGPTACGACGWPSGHCRLPVDRDLLAGPDRRHRARRDDLVRHRGHVRHIPPASRQRWWGYEVRRMARPATRW
jgi:hypothetical protein